LKWVTIGSIVHTLTEEIEIAGDWWLPESPDSTVPGILYFSSKGIKLHVHQSFNPLDGAVRPGDESPKYSVIHGVTVKSEAVTLFDAQQLGTSFNFSSGGVTRPSHIHARILIFGAHLSANFIFSEVSFRVPGLTVWLGNQVINHELTFNAENKLLEQAYKLGKMPSDSFQITKLDAILSIYYGYTSKADAYNSIRVDVSAWSSFASTQKQPIDWFIQQQTRLLSLLSFLSGRVFVSDAIQAKIDDSKHRIDILFVSNNSKNNEFNHPVEFFLSKPALSKSLDEIVNKWFEIIPSVEKPVSLAIGISGSDSLWIHIEFLSLMQALEGLHRALYDGNYMEDSKYADVKSVLSSSIPSYVQPDHKDALRSRIRYGNQKSLRKRLDELVSKLSLKSRDSLFGIGNGIPRTWIDTRNYYTHWDEELLSNILDIQSMYYANEKMKCFICILYAQLAGVCTDDIEKAFLGSSRMAQQIVNINVIQLRKENPDYIPQAIMTITSQDASDSDDPDLDISDELKS
jgi:hypothetical protein